MLIAVLAAAGVLFLAHSAPFPFLLDKLGPAESVWRMPHVAGRPVIYLTFDDGPNPAATPALLDVLAREGARATFFLIDRHVTSETAPIVTRMFAEGHAVALHSHTRALMMLAPSRLAATLDAAADRIEALTGRRPCRAFRPHAGWRSWPMLEGLDRIGYRLVGWSWMMWDWDFYRRPRADRLARKIGARASPGAIVVVHDGHHEGPRADRRYAVDAMARLIPDLKAKGFGFGSVCDSAADQF